MVLPLRAPSLLRAQVDEDLMDFVDLPQCLVEMEFELEPGHPGHMAMDPDDCIMPEGPLVNQHRHNFDQVVDQCLAELRVRLKKALEERLNEHYRDPSELLEQGYD